MTPQRRAILDFYLRAYRLTRACPSMAETQARFPVSRQAIYAHLAALVQDGYLQYQRPVLRAYRPGKKRPPKEAP